MTRAVVDCSVLVSALIAPNGPAGAVLTCLAQARFRTVWSTALLEEVREVLSRPKLRRLFGQEAGRAAAVVDLVRTSGSQAVPQESIRACRDPDDDMVLEAAVAGHADAIVTADKDLLVLHPFRGIAIVPLGSFLRMLA